MSQKARPHFLSNPIESSQDAQRIRETGRDRWAFPSRRMARRAVVEPPLARRHHDPARAQGDGHAVCLAERACRGVAGNDKTRLISRFKDRNHCRFPHEFPTINPLLPHFSGSSARHYRWMTRPVIGHAKQPYRRGGVRDALIEGRAVTAGSPMGNRPADPKAPYRTADLSPSQAP